MPSSTPATVPADRLVIPGRRSSSHWVQLSAATLLAGVGLSLALVAALPLLGRALPRLHDAPIATGKVPFAVVVAPLAPTRLRVHCQTNGPVEQLNVTVTDPSGVLVDFYAFPYPAAGQPPSDHDRVLRGLRGAKVTIVGYGLGAPSLSCAAWADRDPVILGVSEARFNDLELAGAIPTAP